MKWIGIASVIISALLFGNFKSDSLKKRLDILKKTHMLICTVEEKTRLEQKSLHEIFCSVGSSELEYINVFQKYIFEFSQPEAIEKALFESDDPISYDDRVFLSDFYKSLGKNDLQKELEKIRSFIEKLEYRITESENEYLRKGALYRKVSLLSGLLAAVFLI